jgi:formylglycine-generating enzyme required for sulfatase activity
VSAEDAQAEFVVDLWVSDGALKAALPIHIVVHHSDPTASVQVMGEKSGLVADGQSTTDITVFLTNVSNHPVPDEIVRLSTDLGKIDSPAHSLNDGKYLSTYTAGTTPGTATLRATTSSGVTGEAQIILEPSVPVVTARKPTTGEIDDPKSPVTPPQSSMDNQQTILIPAGDLEMGDGGLGRDERAPRTVHVEAFYIDRFEVTNQEYANFLTEVGYTVDEAGNVMIDLDLASVQISVSANGYQPNPGYEAYPVVGVSWHGANAYARWAGKRLLTETEWERAARGWDGRIYPWGSEPTSINLLNYKRRHAGPVSIGSYPQGVSPFGVHDMAGNVAEWVMDNHDAIATSKVVRGGSWESLHPISVRSTERFMLSPDQMASWIGFRCGTDVR